MSAEMTDAFLFLTKENKVTKITVTYTYDPEGDGLKEVVWVREGKNAHYFYDQEVDVWWFTCDDQTLVVNDDSAQLISFEFSGENEDELTPKRGKKK